MDALKIALETMIVGALGLPWMFLLVDLFCAEREPLLKSLLDRLGDKATSTVAGIFLFALAYLIGASVARVADDFFNDDDLGISISEDGIRTSVYCDPSDRWLVQNGAVLVDNDGNRVDSRTLCPADRKLWENNVRQTYAVQESALLLAGSANTDRLRYLHQQHVVLRGVAWDAIVTTLFFVFGAFAKHRSWGRPALLALSLFISVCAVRATVHHVGENWGHFLSAPPLMEITLVLLALAGFILAGKEVPQRPYECGGMFSAVLTFLAISGWWYSEILYDRTVIYFFYAQAHKASALLQ